jgi:aryl-alcohol dehydrogenase-like predicted oxidoreductase
MNYRSLGRTGLQISTLSLGASNFCNPTPEAEAIRIVHRAVDAGINCFDTANIYSDGASERVLGRALADGGRRDNAVVVTKVHYATGPGPNDQGNSRAHILRACEDSLRRLQTEYIDLYLIHRPSDTVPVEETLRALDDLVRAGKVRYVGCSTHPAWKVLEGVLVASSRGYSPYAAEESPYNLLDRRIENELIPMCRSYGVGILAWSPMAMGVLAGRYPKGEFYPTDSRAARRGPEYAGRATPRAIEVGSRFVAVAQARGIPPGRLAVLWVTAQQGITTAICGPRTTEQLEFILPVAEMQLDESVRAACDDLVPPGTAVADFHNTSGWMKMRI